MRRVRLPVRVSMLEMCVPPQPPRAPRPAPAPLPPVRLTHPPVAALPESAGKATKYCSRACQRADWPTHRRTCAPPREPPGDTVLPSTVASLARPRARRPPSFADRSGSNDAAPDAAATPARTTPAPPRSTHRRPARAPWPSPCRVLTSPRRVGALVEYETSSRRFARSPPARARTRRATRPTFPRARGPPPLASGR